MSTQPAPRTLLQEGRVRSHRTAPAVRVLTSAGDLAALAPGWEHLDGQGSWTLTSSAWMRAWLEERHADDELRVVVVGPLDAPQAVVPLVRPAWSRGHLRLPGPPGEAEPVDLHAADATAMTAVAAALCALRRPLHLVRLDAASAAVPALQAALGRRGLLIVRRASPAPAVALDRSWAEPQPPLSSRRQSDLRRARRRAQRHGTLALEVLTPDPASLPGVLADALRIEGAGWKGREGTALERAQDELAVYRRFARLAAAQGRLRISFLRLGDRRVAMQLAEESGGALRLLKIGFDEDVADCSPGQILLAEVLRDAALRGLRSVEFLGAVAPWTKAWTATERETVTLRVYPASARAAVALGREAARHAPRPRRPRRP